MLTRNEYYENLNNNLYDMYFIYTRKDIYGTNYNVPKL